jgi:hypothetical protein
LDQLGWVGLILPVVFLLIFQVALPLGKLCVFVLNYARIQEDQGILDDQEDQTLLDDQEDQDSS